MSRRFEKRRASLPRGAEAGRPMIAIVGRPNVGKSTLFNRLAGRRLAIVEDIPGVTRDRHYADADILGRDIVLIDTGGFDPESDDPMTSGIVFQVELALEECDGVVCIFDGAADATEADKQAVQLLRKAKKPTLYVANKVDNPNRAIGANSLYELGVKELLFISAAHGRGIGELEDAVSKMLPPIVEQDTELDEEIPRVAIVGRPNAGKSSLVNHLTGDERQIVDSRPGTTIDSVDSMFEKDGKELVLIDTAGIRRKRAVKKERGIEAISVYKAIRAMERSDVVVMMIDGDENVGEQDAKIAGLANNRGCAMVIGFNKSDLLPKDEIKKRIERTKEILKFAGWAEVIPVSAKTGRGVNKLLTAVHNAAKAHRKRASTSDVNKFFEEVLVTHPPPTNKGKAVRFKYITQVSTAPPTFVIMTNAPDAVHFSYQRYVVNQIRERWKFYGTPVRVIYRKPKGRAKNPAPNSEHKKR